MNRHENIANPGLLDYGHQNLVKALDCLAYADHHLGLKFWVERIEGAFLKLSGHFHCLNIILESFFVCIPRV